MKYPSGLNPPYLTLYRCSKTLNNIYRFSLLQKPAKIYIICILNFNVSLCQLVGGKCPVSIFFLNFCFSHLLVQVYSQLLASQFSLAIPIELSQKSHNHLTFIMKFNKVLHSSKETSLQEGGPIPHNLCGRIYNFLVNLEDS